MNFQTQKKIFIYFLNLFSLFLILSSITLAVLPATTTAQEKAPPQSTQDRCKKYKDQFKITSPEDPKKEVNITEGTPVFCSVTDFLLPLINYGLLISGTITILFLMVGGFWYLTSAGNEEQAEKGKKTLINSVIGLVVIMLSFAIVRIVSSTVALGK